MFTWWKQQGLDPRAARSAGCLYEPASHRSGLIELRPVSSSHQMENILLEMSRVRVNHGKYLFTAQF